MREIIFRGKRVNNGEWVYGSLVIFDDNQMFTMPPYKYASSLSCTELFEVMAIPIIPETVGQYTGLTDKNGTKIFEGDIIKRNYSKPCVVTWFEYQFVMMWKFKNLYRNFERVYDGEIEVIGNIHDNPEFIESEVETK